MRKLLNLIYICPLLSENYTVECGLAVVARKRNGNYVDERNCQTMPTGQFEAGGQI